jgi:pimeloyl-ACP methyl ester carboxylesterase
MTVLPLQCGQITFGRAGAARCGALLDGEASSRRRARSQRAAQARSRNQVMDGTLGPVPDDGGPVLAANSEGVRDERPGDQHGRRHRREMSTSPLNVERRGSGPPLLLVHGLGASWPSWSPVLDELARHRQIVAIDLPGFGGSDPLPVGVTFAGLTDAVAEFISSEGLDGVDTVGSSMGARIVLELARRGVGGDTVALNPGGFWSRGELRYFSTSLRASIAWCSACNRPCRRSPATLRDDGAAGAVLGCPLAAAPRGGLARDAQLRRRTCPARDAGRTGQRPQCRRAPRRGPHRRE